MTREREENPRTEGPLPEICTALILQSPVSTWIADRDGTNVFENEAARRLFGIERDEEVVGKYNIFRDDVLIAGGFMPQIRKVFEEGGSTEIIVDYDFSKVKHVEPGQPTHRFLRGFLFAIKDREGGVRNVIVQHEDWTDRARTESALEESERRYRQLVEDVSDWIWEVDAEGRYTYASPAVERMLGYKPEEVVGKSPFDFIAPESRHVVREEFEAAIGARREIVALLNGSIRKDGSLCYLETSGRPIFDEEDNLVGYRGVDRDVTDRIRAEEELQRHKEHLEELVQERTTELTQAYERLHTIADTSPLAVVTLDLDGKVTSWNPAAENMFGWAAQEVIGKPMPNLPDDQLPVYREFTQRLLRGEVLTGEEVRNIRKDGTRVEISVSV
ncbi:MAG: PAS domain S-box protein, partial [Armatimonadetes bacterium]|nr:PAS domain S-box protein [Armatimonadota bacterium]